MNIEGFLSKQYHIERGDPSQPMPEYTLRYCDLVDMMKRIAKEQNLEDIKVLEDYMDTSGDRAVYTTSLEENVVYSLIARLRKP